MCACSRPAGPAPRPLPLSSPVPIACRHECECGLRGSGVAAAGLLDCNGVTVRLRLVNCNVPSIGLRVCQPSSQSSDPCQPVPSQGQVYATAFCVVVGGTESAFISSPGPGCLHHIDIAGKGERAVWLSRTGEIIGGYAKHSSLVLPSTGIYHGCAYAGVRGACCMPVGFHSAISFILSPRSNNGQKVPAPRTLSNDAGGSLRQAQKCSRISMCLEHLLA